MTTSSSAPAPGNARLKLRTLPLTSARAAIRNSSFVLIAVSAAVAAVGYVLPAHRVPDYGSIHSNAADGGPLPLLVAAFVFTMALVLRRYRLGAGIAAGVIGAAGAIGAVAPVVLAHLFQHVEVHYGENVFAAGVLGMFFIGAALMIAEPVLYLLERRRIEQASRPAPLPVAIATLPA